MGSVSNQNYYKGFRFKVEKHCPKQPKLVFENQTAETELTVFEF